MSNFIYDREEVLRITAEYFYQKNKGEIISLSFEKLYSEIVRYASVKYKRTKMPAVSQMRKFIIAELEKDMNDDGDEQKILYTKGERFTSEVAYRLKKRYYNDENIEEILRIEYDVFVYCETPIICTVKLPPVEMLDVVAEGYSDENNKSVSWGRINFIKNLCKKIKNKAPSIILAVISGLNRMVYLNENAKISENAEDFNILCNTLCIFVRNSPEGRAFIEKIKNSPHYLNEITKE